MSITHYPCESYIFKVPLTQESFGEAISPRTKEGFYKRLRSRLSWRLLKQWTMTESQIIDSTLMYSDRYLSFSKHPIIDLISYSRMICGWTLGGLPTDFPRLHYSVEKILRPGDLIGGISEGITGHFLKIYYSKEFLSRPAGTKKGCDGILEDKGNKSRGVLEIKGTINSMTEARSKAVSASSDLLWDLDVAQKWDPSFTFAISVGVSLNTPFKVNCIEYTL